MAKKKRKKSTKKRKRKVNAPSAGKQTDPSSRSSPFTRLKPPQRPHKGGQ